MLNNKIENNSMTKSLNFIDNINNTKEILNPLLKVCILLLLFLIFYLIYKKYFLKKKEGFIFVDKIIGLISNMTPEQLDDYEKEIENDSKILYNELSETNEKTDLPGKCSSMINDLTQKIKEFSKNNTIDDEIQQEVYQIDENEEELIYYVTDSAIMGFNNDNHLIKANYKNLSNKEFINLAVKKINYGSKYKAFVVKYKNKSKKDIEYIAFKNNLKIYDKKDINDSYKDVFFSNFNLTEAKNNWMSSDNNKFRYKIWDPNIDDELDKKVFTDRNNKLSADQVKSLLNDASEEIDNNSKKNIKKIIDENGFIKKDQISNIINNIPTPIDEYIINEENDFLPDEFPYLEEIQEENDFQTYVTDEKIYDPNTTIYPHQEEEYSYQQYQFDETLLNEKDKIIETEYKIMDAISEKDMENRFKNQVKAETYIKPRYINNINNTENRKQIDVYTKEIVKMNELRRTKDYHKPISAKTVYDNAIPKVDKTSTSDLKCKTDNFNIKRNDLSILDSDDTI